MFSAGLIALSEFKTQNIIMSKKVSDEAENPALNKGAVICSACGVENSMRWEKKEISIDDKQGSYKDLTFDFCEECGNVTNVDLS